MGSYLNLYLCGCFVVKLRKLCWAVVYPAREGGHGGPPHPIFGTMKTSGFITNTHHGLSAIAVVDSFLRPLLHISTTDGVIVSLGLEATQKARLTGEGP